MTHETNEQGIARKSAASSDNAPESRIMSRCDACGGVQVAAVRLRGRGGLVALVSPSDLDVVERFRWYALRRKHTTYAVRSDRMVSMHSLLLQVPRGKEVDHRDGDGLHNCRTNLRVATRSQQLMNRRGWGKSRFKGVSPEGGRWRAQIAKDHKDYLLGVFDTEEEAAIAYDRAAMTLHGEFARLNFPEVRRG